MDIYELFKTLHLKIKDFNGNWIPDWSDENLKYVIRVVDDEIDTSEYKYGPSRSFVFPSSESRSKFIEKHEQELIKIKELL